MLMDSCNALLAQYASLTEDIKGNNCLALPLPSGSYGHLNLNAADGSGDHGGHGGHGSHSGEGTDHGGHGGHGSHSGEGTDHGGHGGHGGHHAGCTTSHGQYSVGLHVGAIFILLFASFIGTMIPIAGKYVSALRMNQFVLIIAKCISTGVVLAVALLTMINHSLHSFMEDCLPDLLKSDTYDAYALLLAMISAMLMHALDVVMDIVLESWTSEGANKSSLEVSKDVSGGLTTAEKPTSSCGMEVCPDSEGNCNIGGCCGDRAAIAASRFSGARRVAAALLMEFGLTLHSVFLGLSVGIANDDNTKSLLVALTFHQMFEGLALGSRLADASLGRCVEMLMTLIFSFSVPLGTLIGLITMESPNVNMTGSTFVTLQGVVNAIGGGILIYIGFTLLLHDFPRDMQAHVKAGMTHRGWRCFGMLLAVWVGAAIMAFLANIH